MYSTQKKIETSTSLESWNETLFPIAILCNWPNILQFSSWINHLHGNQRAQTSTKDKGRFLYNMQSYKCDHFICLDICSIEWSYFYIGYVFSFMNLTTIWISRCMLLLSADFHLLWVLPFPMPHTANKFHTYKSALYFFVITFEGKETYKQAK